MHGDEARLREVQRQPERGEEPVHVGGPREWRQIEPHPEVVSARKGDDGHGRQRGDDDLRESISNNDGVHEPKVFRRRREHHESALKSGLLLYDWAQVTDATEFHFDGWTLRTRSGELVRDGNSQRLPQQPLRVLVELLTHPGDVVTRERLVEVLWP